MYGLLEKATERHESGSTEYLRISVILYVVKILNHKEGLLFCVIHVRDLLWTIIQEKSVTASHDSTESVTKKKGYRVP